MANILVYIGLDDGSASSASLAALNLGRTVASDLGAAVYALLPCKAPPTYDEDDIITVISRHGADKVILITNPGLDLPPPAEVIGPVLIAACKRFPPRLMLIPGEEEIDGLGQELANALNGDLVRFPGDDEPDPDEVFLPRQMLLDTADPLVVLVDGAPAPRTMGEADTEVVVFQAPVVSVAGEEEAGDEGKGANE